MENTKVTILLPRGDNYIYLLHLINNQVAVIDPGTASPVLAHLKENNLKLSHVLLTHYHGDHTGGTSALIWETGAEVWCGSERTYSGADRILHEGVSDLAGTPLTVFSTPGHTPDHHCYMWEGSLFTGDVLFCGGCGRLSGNTAADMFSSFRKWDNLPEDTPVYPGHEYTEENYRFARKQFPDDPQIIRRQQEITQQLRDGHYTVPTTLQEERQSNVFFRASTVEEFSSLRRKKNRFF